MPRNSALETVIDCTYYSSAAVEQKRQELFATAKAYGMYAEETLRCSQELDRLIIQIQSNQLPS
ncbi:MAG: aspartyl-phosphate phosphatase Spo0E family protein [Sporolactobacillus sp.]